jgi:hypothetical protein
MKSSLVDSPHERGRTVPKKEKTCKFPDCTEKFMGVGAAKYCKEHRKPFYRKVINMIRREEEQREVSEFEKGEKSNQIIIHEETIAKSENRYCPCGKEFEIKLYPNIEVYPKFCEEHRNPFRRELLLEKLAEEEEFGNIEEYDENGDM